MALVSYGSSDESCNSDEDIEDSSNIVNETKKELTKESCPSIKDAISDEEDVNSAELSESTEFFESELSKNLKYEQLFKNLPEPTVIAQDQFIDENEDVLSIPKAKIYDETLPEKPMLKKTKGPVKISAPALSTYSNVDSLAQEPLRIVKKSGSGLLASLPEPKFSKSRGKISTLNNLLSKQSEVNTDINNCEPIVKKVKTNIFVPKSVSNNLKDKAKGTDDDSDEEIDFFNFNEASKVSGIPDAQNYIPKLDVPVSPALNSEPQATNYDHRPNQHVSNTIENFQSVTQSLDDYYSNQKSKEEEILHEQALQKLAGKRNAKLDKINFKEISQDDIKANTSEWMMKSLTEEQNIQSYSHRSKGGPSSLSKRKHQITSLAYQAKERELELKNMWNNNRATKQQSAAKYGF